MRYAQLVIGPAGSGKSTYCSTIVNHAEVSRRTVNVVNLDPAAEYFAYNVLADIRELIEVDDVMTDETLNFGPNGGLIFCMKYFIEQIEWLQEQLGEDDDDYILFDCPGQIELYTHMDIFRQFVEALQNWNFRVCAVFLIDSQFMIEPSKFVSGVLTALSTMINLELPHVNILTKLDLLSKKAKEDIECFLESDVNLLVSKDSETSHWNKKFYNLTKGIAKLIDDYGMVQFVPLDITDEESIGDVLLHIDNTIQYGEDLDVRPPRDIDEDDDDDGFASGAGDGGS